MSDITLDWSFGSQLRRYRIEKEITLREMCRRTSMDPGNYSKMERAELAPPKDKIEIKKLLKPLRLNQVQESLILSAAYNFHCGRLFERFWNEAGPEPVEKETSNEKDELAILEDPKTGQISGCPPGHIKFTTGCEHKNGSGNTYDPFIVCSDCGAKGTMTLTITWEIGPEPVENETKKEK